MASKEQLEFFQSLYAREHERYLELINRGKLYLSIVSLYFSAIALAAGKTTEMVRGSSLAASAYLVGVTTLAVSMGLILSAIGIYRYAYPCDPKQIISNGELKLLDAEEFREERLFEYAAAADTDHQCNEKRATMLRYASFALLGGIVAHLCAVVFMAWTG